MIHLRPDDKANIALLVSVGALVVPIVSKVLASRKKSEVFSKNVITRTEMGSFDRPETHYVVNPAYIRKSKDRFMVPGLGMCEVSDDMIKQCKINGMWFDFVDHSTSQDIDLDLYVIGIVPKP
jgi:hypothetical protein